MSIYEENVSIFELIKSSPRVISNLYYMFRAGENAGKPFGIKFEVSALCNLKCKMCPQSTGLNRKKGLLSFKNFKKVFDEIRPPYLNLTGIGEPLLNPDLFKIITYARKKGAIVKLDTNATLLNEKNANNLILSNPNIISISIDSSDKKIYEDIRAGANFDVVIKNLKKLILLRNNLKSNSKIHVNFVLQRNNVKELINFIKYLDSLGIDSINGDIALPLGGNKNLKNRDINPNLLEKLKLDLKKLKTRASLNIEHVEEFLEPKDKILKRRKVCFYPWYYPSITWDGNLVPCCYICDNEIVFGNVIEEPFMKVWNNKKINEFRNMTATKRKGYCEGCFIDETYIANNIIKLHKIVPFSKKISNMRFD